MFDVPPPNEVHGIVTYGRSSASRGAASHRGSGLEPERDPDRTEQAKPPAECRSFGAGLATYSGNRVTPHP